MMYGYVKGYPLNALWGFKYGGTWKSVEEFERNSVTNTYVSALAINSDAASRKASLGMPRYYDINNDGSLNKDDLVYQGNADPDLYGGLQNNFRFGRLNVGIYFTYSLGGKIYNYSELYMPAVRCRTSTATCSKRGIPCATRSRTCRAPVRWTRTCRAT